MQSIGQTSTHALSFTPMQGSVITNAIALNLPINLRLILKVVVQCGATGDVAFNRLGRIVVTEPFHALPRPLPPDGIIDPQQWFDDQNAQAPRGCFYRPHR